MGTGKPVGVLGSPKRPEVLARRTKLNASVPNNLSDCFHPIEDCIFRFESLFSSTSKGTPGAMRDAFVQSDP